MRPRSSSWPTPSNRRRTTASRRRRRRRSSSRGTVDARHGRRGPIERVSERTSTTPARSADVAGRVFRDYLAGFGAAIFVTVIVSSFMSPVTTAVWPANFARSANVWLLIAYTLLASLSLTTSTYFSPPLMHLSTHVLASILCTPAHIASEIWPVQLAGAAPSVPVATVIAKIDAAAILLCHFMKAS